MRNLFYPLSGMAFLLSACDPSSDFSMRTQNATISIAPGGSITLPIALDTSDPKQPVSVWCRGIGGTPLPPVVACPSDPPLSDWAPVRMAFPITIRSDATIGDTTIEIVGHYLDQEQVLQLQIHITDLELFGSMPNGSQLYTRIAWQREIGTIGTDQVSSVVVDQDGSVYTAGQTTGAFVNHSNLGILDGFLIKYHPNGALEWLQQFGTPGSDVVSSIAVDKDGQILVAGYTYDAFPGQTSAGHTDAFVAKYTSHGTQVWLHQFGTSELDHGTAVSTDAQGHIYLLGTTEGSFPGFTNAGNTDLFLSKWNTDGTLVWTKQFGTNDTDTAGSILMLPTGEVLLAGSTLDAFPGQTSQGAEDAWLALYTADGTQAWLKQFGTRAADAITALTGDGSGKIYAAGNTRGEFPGQNSHGGQDGFYLMARTDGSLTAPVQFGSSSLDEVHAIALNYGVLFVAGFTNGAFGTTNLGNADAFFAGFNPDGILIGIKQFGTSDTDFVTSLALYVDHWDVGGTTFGAFPHQINEKETDGFLSVFQLVYK